MFGVWIVCVSWLCLFLGVADCIIASSLLASAVKQAQFLPRTYSSCDSATDWGNGTDGRNFFLAANETTFHTYKGPGNLCHKMVELWAITVSMGCVLMALPL